MNLFLLLAKYLNIGERIDSVQNLGLELRSSTAIFNHLNNSALQNLIHQTWPVVLTEYRMGFCDRSDFPTFGKTCVTNSWLCLASIPMDGMQVLLKITESSEMFQLQVSF